MRKRAAGPKRSAPTRATRGWQRKSVEPQPRGAVTVEPPPEVAADEPVKGVAPGPEPEAPSAPVSEGAAMRAAARPRPGRVGWGLQAALRDQD